MKFALLFVLLFSSAAAFAKDFVFDPEVLAEIARSSMNISDAKERVEFIEKALKVRYPKSINEKATWTFNSVGGALAEMKVLFCSPQEYINIWGSPIGTEGHSGRYHQLEVWDVMFAGEMHSYIPGEHEFNVYHPGHTAFLPKGVARGFKLLPQTYMIDYGRGSLISAMGDGASAGHKYVTRDRVAAKQITHDCMSSMFGR